MEKSLPYRRVDKAILQAFIHLAPRIPFEKMTVQDIIDEALVSRYTFYTHFHDKYEVAERVQADLYQRFTDFIEKSIPGIEAQHLAAETHHTLIDQKILEFCRQNYAEMLALKDIHTETVDFVKKMKDYFSGNYLRSQEDRPSLALEAVIYASVITALSEYSLMEYFSFSQVNMSQSVFEAGIHVMAQLIGLHNPGDVETLMKTAKELLYRED